MKFSKKKLNDLSKKGMDSFAKGKIGAKMLADSVKELSSIMNENLAKKMFK